MKKVKSHHSGKKKPINKKKIIGIERISLLRQAFSQLQAEDRTRISGNPVSLVPVFAMQVLYSLRWGGSSSLNSIMTYSSANIPVDTAVVDIELSIIPNGKEKHLEIRSVWTQTDTVMKIRNTCNGKDIVSHNFQMRTEREKFDNATRAMKNLIANTIILVAKGKIK